MPSLQSWQTEKCVRCKPSVSFIFVCDLPQVRHLEQQNKVLETKLQLLQSSPPTESNMEYTFNMYISTLQSELSTLQNNEAYLNAELHSVESLVEDNKRK